MTPDFLPSTIMHYILTDVKKKNEKKENKEKENIDIIPIQIPIKTNIFIIIFL